MSRTRQGMGGWSLGGVAVLLGCSASTRAVVSQTPAPAPTAAPRPWVAAVLESRNAVTTVSEQEGAFNVMAGTVRAQVRGETVRVAETSPLHKLMGAIEENGHWTFLTEDGTYLHADTFLGPLRRVATTGGRPIDTFLLSHHSMLAIGRRQDGAWRAREGRMQPLNTPEPLIDAALTPRGIGFAAIESGVLLRTTDAGSSFEPVNLQGEAIRFVDTDPTNPERLWLYGIAGSVLVSDSGGPPQPLGGEAPTRAALSSEQTTATFRATGPCAENAIVLGASRLAWITGGRVLLASATGEPAEVQSPARRCSYDGWGSTLLASCPDGDAMEYHRLVEGNLWASLGTYRTSGVPVPSADGRSLLLYGACEETPYAFGRSPVCVYDGNTFRTRQIIGDSSVLSMWGRHVLTDSTANTAGVSESDRRPDVRMLSLDSADDGQRMETDPPGGEVSFAQFTPEGEVVAVVQREGRWHTGFGAVGRPLVLRDLPNGARQVAFASRTHGVAIGDNLSQAWVTTDGAVSWAPLSLPVDGDVSSVSLIRPRRPYERIEPSVSCTSELCRIGSRALWMAPGSQAIRYVSSRMKLASTEPVSLSSEAPERGAHLMSGHRIVCDPVESTSQARSDWLSAVSRRRVAPGGFLDIVRGASDATSGRFDFEWRGTDARGRFRGRARNVELPPLTNAESPTLSVVHVARQFVLFERCRSEERGCELWTQQSGRGTTRVADLAVYADMAGPSLPVRATLGLPDGGVVVHLGLGPYGRVDVLLQLGPTGQRVRERNTTWRDDSPLRLLALGSTGPGLALLDPGEAGTVRFIGMDATQPPRPVGRISRRPIAVCEGPTPTLLVGRESATQLSVSLQRAPSRNLYDAARFMSSLLGIDARGEVCLAGMQRARLPNSASDVAHILDEMALLGGQPEIRATGRGLQLLADDGARGQTATCRAQPM